MLGLGNILTKGGAVLAFPNKYSFNFDGSNDYLECGFLDDFVVTNNISVSLWFNASNIQNFDCFFSQRVDANNILKGWYFGDNIIFEVHEGGTKAGRRIAFTPDSNWHHLVFSFDTSGTIADSKVQIYLDGALPTQTDIGGYGNSGCTESFRIGSANDTNYFTGKIDEFAFWNALLSADDVAKIASKPVDFSKASTYATDRTSNLKLWLRAGDKAEPESTTAIARQDFYTDFDGTDDHVVLGGSSPDSAFSISAWVFDTHSHSGSDFSAIYSANSTAIWFGVKNNSINGLVRLHVNGNSNYADTPSGSFSSPSNEWIHLVGTWDGTNAKIYINGVSQTLTVTGTLANPTASANPAIGINDSNHSFNQWTGSISNVSIYKTALDAQTISQMAKSRFTPMRDNRFSVVDFDGSNDYIDCGNDTSLQFSGSFSIGCWFRTTDATASNEHLFSKYNGGADAGFALLLDSNRKINFWYAQRGSNDSGGLSFTTIVDSGSAINDGAWHHVMGVFTSGSKVELFKDGVSVGTSTSNVGNLASHVPNLFIASQDAGNKRPLACEVSSASIYNTAKSAEEVYAIYQQGITYDESSLSGLVGYWRMGDDTSKAYPTIADSSSNSNDGTITNGSINDIVQQMVAGYDLGAFESSSEELGAELLTNGTFDTDSDWTKGDGWTIANGVASSDETAQSTHSYLTQSVSFKSGVLYKVSYDLVYNDSAGNGFLVQFTGGGSPSGTGRTSSGSFVDYIRATANHTAFNFRSSDGSATGTVDNLSLKEVLQSEVSDTYPAIIDVNEPVLGVNIVDNNVADSWISAGGNSDANITNGVQLIFGGGANANYAYINDNLLSTAGLASDTLYKTTFTASYSGGSSAPSIRLNDGTTNYDNVLTTTPTEYEVYFMKNGSPFLQIINQVTSNVTDVINWEIKQVSGNVGTMTNQDSADLVYSSVLPDQSFLTGVNSAYNFIDLDGTDAFINCGGDIDVVGAFAISFWFNADTLSASARNFACQGNSFFGTGSSAGANRLMYQGQSSGANNLVTQTDLSTGVWHHAVLTVSGTNAGDGAIYVNGSRDDDGASTVFMSAGDFVIGKMPTASSRYMNGKITQVAIYNKALTSTEVSGIYNLGRHGNLLDSYSDNLKGYWVMGGLDSKTGLADTDSTIYDRSGNSNHGTISGTATGDFKSPPNAEPNGYAKGDTNRSTTTP